MLSGGTKEKALITTKTPRHQERQKAKNFRTGGNRGNKERLNPSSRLLCNLC
jgi:hypothetical protein